MSVRPSAAAGAAAPARITSVSSKTKRAAAVTDVEDDAAPTRFEDFLADASVARDRGVGKWTEAMRQDISATQAGEHFEPTRRRIVEMRHDREPGLPGDFEGHVEGCHPGSAAGVAPDSHLDPGDQIAVGVDDAHAFA